MKKLRCESCGGELRVEENGEYANCDYCRTKYKLNEDKTIVIKFDDSVKDIDKNVKTAAVPFIILGVTFVIFFIMVFGIMLYNKNKTTNDFNSNVAEKNEIYESNINLIDSNKNSMEEEYKVSNFNFPFNMYRGTMFKSFIENLIDEINSSNQSKDRKITLVYKDKSMVDSNAITEFKHSLNKEKYTIKYEYDKEGYITKVVLSDAK